MLRYVLALLGACCIGWVGFGAIGCGGEPTAVPETTTLVLNRLASGDLEYCDDTGVCHELPYTGECAVVHIVIDNVRGTTCERCIMTDGSVIDHGCENTLVACVVITIPEPDCVVCAYLHGDVIYSSCVVDEPECFTDADCRDPNGVPGYCVEGTCVFEPYCYSDADCPRGFECVYGPCPYAELDDMAPCLEDWCWPCVGSCHPRRDLCEGYWCPPGSHCEVTNPFCVTCDPEPRCVPDYPYCETDSDCPAGYECESQPCPMGAEDMMPCTPEWCPPCYGVCVPVDPCATIDCMPGYHCELQDVVCITWPCDPVPVCVRDHCVVTGCSGQLCAHEPMASTCEWLPEYACYRDAQCAPQPDGECGWTPTQELLLCLERNR